MGRGYQLRILPQAVFAPWTGPWACSAWFDRVRERDLLRYSADTLLMKKLTLLGAIALFATSIGAQSPATDDQKEVEALLRKVQAQQIVIADNQAKIDAKLATVAEAIRVARIYGSRGGR
jgi:hypothetical protein